VIVIETPIVSQDNQWLVWACILKIPSYLGNKKKQGTISKSFCEAEYRAMTIVTCEIQWLTYLFQDFKVHFEQPSRLYCDNDLIRYIVGNSVFHEPTKYIEIDCHIVREN